MFTNSHKATLYKAKRQPAAEGCLVKKQRSDFMDNELFNFLTSQGIFALLFGYLLLYVLKQNQIREENYQSIIKQLSDTLPEIQNDLEDNRVGGK